MSLLNPEYLLVDESTTALGNRLGIPIYSMGEPTAQAPALPEVDASRSGNLQSGEVQECWSISFTSGTTGVDQTD